MKLPEIGQRNMVPCNHGDAATQIGWSDQGSFMNRPLSMEGTGMGQGN